MTWLTKRTEASAFPDGTKIKSKKRALSKDGAGAIIKNKILRTLLTILFVSIYNLNFSQVSGVVKIGGYLYPSTTSSVDEAIRYCPDGQTVIILGKFKGNSNYLVVDVGGSRGFMYHSAIKNSSTITNFAPSSVSNYPPSSKGNSNYPPSSEGNNNNWNGNGSGVIISTKGYIVTNNHVIENTSNIEVEFKYKGEFKSFNAKVIKTDITNDLAIIKIDDPNFSDLPVIPYNIDTNTSEVGSSVFALGYPMALSGMGKDVKFTDGKISSKTGFQGDITTYQTTAPIQPGNSGGPLFDFKGNLIGINSSGLDKRIADNVAYSIKASYILNLIDVLPENISIPSSKVLADKTLTEQIKILSDFVVLIKIKVR